VDTKAPLSNFYSAEVLDALKSSPDTISPWGIPQGQGALVGASLGELPVPQAIAAMTSGDIAPKAAAQQAAEALREIAASLD